MADHKDKKKKRIMHKFKLGEISAVDKPAQSPALCVIMKRNDGETIEKRTVLASMEALHTHAVVIDDYAKMNKGGNTGWVDEHDHPFVINDDGTVTIGAAKGHLHFVEKNVEQITKNGLSDEQITDLGLVLEFSKDIHTADDGGQQSANEDNTMTDAEKAVKKAADDLTLLKNQLALAILMGSMNDAQKAHHAGLDDAGKEVFLAKSVDDREVIVKAAAKAAEDDNAEVYKTRDGIVFTKADDPRMVTMAKNNDIQAAQIAKSAEVLANVDIAKRATELFKNLSGDVATQTALLKAVDGIKDEEARKSVMETLAKSDAGIGDLLKEHGSSTVVAKAGSADEANGKLEALAKKYVQDNPGTNAFDAYGIVGDANPELYTQAVG